MARQPDGIHTIPVPHGMSVEQAWENISRNVALIDPNPDWVNVEVKDSRFVRIVPLAEIDLLAELNAMYRRLGTLMRHPRLEGDAYNYVRMATRDAERAIRDALDGWPA